MTSRTSLIRRRSRANDRLRKAFTLLEVILAVAILAGSTAALGELLRMATNNAKYAVNLTHAQLLAEEKMAEIIDAGVVPDPVNEVRFSVTTDAEYEYTEWLYSIQVNRLPDPALVEIRVELIQDVDPTIYRQTRFSLVRWMLDQESLDAMIPETETEEGG